MTTREWLRRHCLKARLLSFSKTWPQICDGSKTVTRRRSTVLKRGDLFEPVEWPPRVGARIACVECDELIHDCRCDCELACSRPPFRGPLQAVVGVRKEQLGKITAEDVEREGFHGSQPSEFIALFVGLNPSVLAQPWTKSDRRKYERACGSMVYRIEFTPVSLNDAGLAIVDALRTS